MKGAKRPNASAVRFAHESGASGRVLSAVFNLPQDELYQVLTTPTPKITREGVANLLLAAAATSKRPADLISAARELGKLYGLYEQQDMPTVTLDALTTRISRMTTAELEAALSAVAGGEDALTAMGLDAPAEDVL